jgi:CubicO group peptidase (beta-lactamase class C family)
VSEATGLEAIEGWPAPHAAAGWLRRDGVSATAGDQERVFALASVTKLLTAAAVLVAVQEEIVDLDEPAGPPGSTLRLLLAHASGLPPDGEEPIGPPGQRRIYGNAAYEVLGRLVAARAEMPFATYLDEAVLQPLAMGSTRLTASPASGAESTVADVLRFAGELLAPGRVLAPEVLAAATTPQLPDLVGVLPGYGRQDPNPWGLGFEIRGAKSPHWTPAHASPATFGHFGQSGCFLWVDPVAGVALTALTDLDFGPWAVTAWPPLGEIALSQAVGR